MGMKEQPKIVHRSMQGKVVDMNKMSMQNEMTVAVGNIRMNARGDYLGPGGAIVKTHEEVMKENNKGVPDQQRPVQVKKNIEDMDPEGNE